MTILNNYELHKLAINSYIEFNESIDNKLEGLVAMKILPPQKDYSDEAYAEIIHQTLEKVLDKKYLMEAMVVLQQNTLKNFEISIPQSQNEETVFWSVYQKDGAKVQGSFSLADAKIMRDIEGHEMQRDINGTTYERRQIELPQEVLDGIAFGYHSLELKISDSIIKTDLAYAPEKCYQPIKLGIDKVRGTSVAIPSIRSAENMGMGNYSDMAQFAHIAAQNNLDIVGTLPLHAMNHKTPESASPYSPISRTFFNFGYLDVTAIEDFINDKDIQMVYDSAEYENARRKNQDAWTVDYTSTYQLLMPMLKKCYLSFEQNATPQRKQEFAHFTKEKGLELENFAIFEALSEYFASQTPSLTDWRDWPEDFQNPNAPKVKTFANKNQESIKFFSYLQWQSLKQVQNIQKTCIENGMKIGLYTDLAVGTTPAGFEAWAYKDVYIDGSIGIPPDMCSVEGQNWGIIGYNPNALEEKGFKPFISMMEANMQGGMLRIDCPLAGFVKSNFIPNGKTPKDCFSIYMPTDKLMALAAISSHKSKTPILFEDLGAIPDYFRAKIEKMEGITYKVLPYERCSTRDFPSSSLVVSSTHDSETLDIGWKGESAYLLANRNCLPKEYVENYLHDSWEYRRHMVGLLKEEKCIEDADFNLNCSTPKGYFKGVAKLIGDGEHCSSAYGIMPISDMLGLPHWRENIPGTPELHTSQNPSAKGNYSGKGGNLPNPNWRLKLPLYLNEIAINPRFVEVASTLSSASKPYKNYVRPGRTEAPRRNPNRLVELYTKLAIAEQKRIENGEEPRFSGDAAYAIWGAKFSDKKKQSVMNKAALQASDFATRQKNIESYKAEYYKNKDVLNYAIISKTQKQN